MQVTTIGLDIAKNVFQVHGIDREGRAILRRKVRRDQLLALFGSLEPCLVGMEACATAHHWARGDCQEFRVWPGIMGTKEISHGPTQRACDS